MAPPPPALPNGNISNGIMKPKNILSPPAAPANAGLLKEIETGNMNMKFVHDSCQFKKKKPFSGISLRKVDPQANRQATSGSYNQGDLMREIREGKKNLKCGSPGHSQ